MEITLMDIKYVWQIDTISQNGTELEKTFNLTGYDITFLLNKEIEGKIHLDTDKEKTVEELKDKILSQIYFGNSKTFKGILFGGGII